MNQETARINNQPNEGRVVRHRNTTAPASARACPACGGNAYRNRLIGYREDGGRIKRNRCDDCCHIAASRPEKSAIAKRTAPVGAPRRESKRARLARVVAIGEAVKARRAAEVMA